MDFRQVKIEGGELGGAITCASLRKVFRVFALIKFVIVKIIIAVTIISTVTVTASTTTTITRIIKRLMITR